MSEQVLEAQPETKTGVDRTPILMLLAASTISSLGNQITNLAVLWFVLETTGSAARTGLVGFFTLLPVALALFFGGALVDRLGHRRMSIIADIASAVTVALIPTLHHTVGLPLWALLGFGTLGFAAVGTLFAAMLVRARSRDVLLPVLLYPITIPVIIGGVRGTAALMAIPADVPLAQFWIALIAFFDIVFVALSLWTFEPLMTD